MDIAGLLFATLSLIDTLVNAYGAVAELVLNVRNFGGDREHVIARVTSEKGITLQLKTLLFSEPLNSHSRLFSQLDPVAQEGLHAIFNQFAKAIDRYLPLDERYLLLEKATVDTPSPPRGPTVATSHGSAERRATGDAKNLRNSPLSAIAMTARWAAWDKRRVSKLIDEFEFWNKKITQVIELHVLDHQVRFYRTGEDHRSMLEIFSTREAEQLGIEDALAAQAVALRLPSSPPEGALVDGFNNEEVTGEFERPYKELQNVRKRDGSSKFEIGQFDNRSVVVDSKIYDRGPRESLKDGGAIIRKDRLNQLTSVLLHLRPLEPSVPECLGWVERPDKGLAISLLFAMPEDVYPEPQSLFYALPNTSLSSGPSLDERLRVAYRLASALDRLHSVSWIHKSIRSENILFYYKKDAVASIQGSNDEEPEALPPQWFLYGFEYARKMDAATSSRLDDDPYRNVYRHPQRWGVPTDNFGAVHDMYALGVVLLELGMWRRATSFIDMDGARQLDPVHVRNKLLRRATNHLSYTAGVAYRDIVLRCLRSDFEVNAPADDSYEARRCLGSKFRSLVVDELRALVLPHLEASQQLGGIP
ncbi:hypothetical protein GQ53DRAFT_755051 [Thozetella sp. PMI_491]|nr:hypothetical protein GQ53DRAFT_755051 [Thozetella sp. PMI_491]